MCPVYVRTTKLARRKTIYTLCADSLAIPGTITTGVVTVFIFVLTKKTSFAI